MSSTLPVACRECCTYMYAIVFFLIQGTILLVFELVHEKNISWKKNKWVLSWFSPKNIYNWELG